MMLEILILTTLISSHGFLDVPIKESEVVTIYYDGIVTSLYINKQYNKSMLGVPDKLDRFRMHTMNRFGLEFRIINPGISSRLDDLIPILNYSNINYWTGK